MSDYTENKTPNLIINTLEDPSKLSEITVGENEIVLVPDETEEEIAKKQDKLVAGTNITLVDDPLTQTTLISSTAQESFFRGRWGNWSLVPSDGNLYPEDYHGNRKPTDNDFMVLSDASDYVNPSSLTHQFTVINTHSTAQFTIKFIDEYGTEHTYYYDPYRDNWVQINEYYSLQYSAGAPGRWYIRTNKPEDTRIVVDGIEYEVDPTGTTVNAGVLVCTTSSSTTPVVGGLPSHVGQYQGAWRFVYHGVWDTNGKLGWTPQYQIENTLPIATSTEPGIAKLYTTTGQNTDGSMTQKSVTDAINRIQDSCFRGNWNTWTDVPVNANLYPEDYKYSHVPTYNDYMVVNDASGYVPSDLLTVELIVVEMTNSTCRYTIGADSYTKTRQSSQDAPFGPNNEMSWNTLGEGSQGTRITFNDQVKYQDHVYNAGESIVLPNESGSYSVADLPKSFFIKRHVDSFSGAWRFSYQGVWATDGKSGWREEYQVENTLPVASPTVAGITKLYTTTGSNTDGTMDQNSITTELNKKQNNLVAGNNITIDQNTDTISAADKTLVSFVIWEDEE